MTTDWLLKPDAARHDPAEELYELYPRKVGRPHALRAIRRALRSYDFDHLRRVVLLYQERTKTQAPQFIPYPATWFNQERFNDDPATWNPGYQPPKPNLMDKEIRRCLREAVGA